MATWDNAYAVAPANNRLASLGAEDIREFKATVHERMIHEHVMNLDVGTNTTDGWHRSGSAKVYVGTNAPTTRPDGTTALSTNDNGRLWYDTTDNLLRRYAHPNWTSDDDSYVNKAYVDTTITGTVQITGAQTITGVKTFSGGIDVSNLQGRTRTTGTTTGSYTVPVGLYYIGVGTDTTAYIRVRDSGGTWNITSTGKIGAPGGGLYISDGTNVEVRQVSGGTCTWTLIRVGA